MNHDEPTDAQLEDLLGTYADALYKSSIVPDGDEDNTARDGLTVSNTNQKANTMNTNDEQAALEVDLQPENDGGSKGRILALVGGVLLVAAVGIGAVSIISNNDSSELDVAVADEQEAEDNSAAVDDSTTTVTTVPEEEPISDGAADSADAAVATSSFNPFGSNSTVFFDGDFSTLTNQGNGFVVTRGIGSDSTETPAVGLPENESAWANYVVEIDSGFAALIEVFPESTDDIGEFIPFGPQPAPERYLATSADMVNWTTVELPALTDSDVESAYLNAIATSGDRVAIVGQINPLESTEQILLEAGRITEEDMFRICSSEFDESSYSIFVCDINEETGDENFEEAPLLTIDASDPLFPEIEAVVSASENPISVLIVGPASGPFEIVDAPVAGWDSSIAGTSDGFLTVGFTPEGIPQAFASTDGGLTWTEASAPASDSSVFTFTTLTSDGTTILGMTQTQGGTVPSTSTDLGQTWTEGSLDTALFSSYGEAVAGPAGFAVQIQGTTEPFETGFPQDGVVLEKDGYTMTIEFLSAAATLTGPDGVLIHEANIGLIEDGIENVLRFDGPGDEDLIWLDPDTGEDLITFTEDDFEAAYPEFAEPQVSDDFVEPDVVSEIWFSADGATWTLLDASALGIESFGGILAVGDDEVVTFNQVFTEPPADLTMFEDGMEPTEEEIAELEAWYENQNDQTTYHIIPVG